jgi:hypothetical protein
MQTRRNIWASSSGVHDPIGARNGKNNFLMDYSTIN